MVGELFIKKTFDNDTERIVYNDKYINAHEDTTEHDLYEIMSDVAFNSGLTHDFSYEVMYLVAMVLENLEHLNEDESETSAFLELVDSVTPIYNYDIMKMYRSDYGVVDQYREELGNTEADSMQAAQQAWYFKIEELAREALQGIEDYNETLPEPEDETPDEVKVIA